MTRLSTPGPWHVDLLRTKANRLLEYGRTAAPWEFRLAMQLQPILRDPDHPALATAEVMADILLPEELK